MNDSSKAMCAAAVVGGYVLGRRRKAKLALAVASYVVGRRFGLGPQQLLSEGMRRMGSATQLGPLGEQFRGELTEAVRAAASAVVDRGLGDLADSLHARTEALRHGEPEDEEEQYEEEPREEVRGRRPTRKRAAGKPARKAPAKKAPAKKSSARKATKQAPARRTAAKKSARKSPAEKAGSSRTADRRR